MAAANVRAILLIAVCVSGFAQHARAAGPPFAESWIDGMREFEPGLQGANRVLEIDTGAGGLKIRPTVDKLIQDRLEAKGLKTIELVIAHSHSHDDHIAGDEEFTGRPNTTVVGHSPEQVAAFFGIHSWPDQSAAFDLGGRVIDIIPAPGHEPAEIAVFDRRTHLLMTGDELYPGRLYVPTAEFATYRRSIDRLVNFTRTRNVSWVLGCHVEMTRKPGRDYPIHAASHPFEHRLELPYASLIELDTALNGMGDQPQLDVHPDFIIYPLPYSALVLHFQECAGHTMPVRGAWRGAWCIALVHSSRARSVARHNAKAVNRYAVNR